MVFYWTLSFLDSWVWCHASKVKCWLSSLEAETFSCRLPSGEGGVVCLFIRVLLFSFFCCFPWDFCVHFSLVVRLLFRGGFPAGGCLAGSGLPGQGGGNRRQTRHVQAWGAAAPWEKACCLGCGSGWGLIALKASSLSASSNDYKQGLCCRASHPGERLASGRFPQDSYKGEE